MLIMDGTGRAGEIVDLVNLDIERKRYLVAEGLEIRIIQQTQDVLTRSGEEVIDRENFMSSVKSRSHRCESRKPAPPVTNMRLALPYSRPIRRR